MPFTSFNLTNPRTNPLNFHKKISRIGDFEKWPFFESAILIFFFQYFFFFFASILWKLVKVYWLARIGRDFDDYSGLQPKITPPKHFSRQCITVKKEFKIIYILHTWKLCDFFDNSPVGFAIVDGDGSYLVEQQ